jgi:hypothetical protein
MSDTDSEMRYAVIVDVTLATAMSSTGYPVFVIGSRHFDEPRHIFTVADDPQAEIYAISSGMYRRIGDQAILQGVCVQLPQGSMSNDHARQLLTNVQLLPTMGQERFNSNFTVINSSMPWHRRMFHLLRTTLRLSDFRAKRYISQRNRFGLDGSQWQRYLLVVKPYVKIKERRTVVRPFIRTLAQSLRDR